MKNTEGTREYHNLFCTDGSVEHIGYHAGGQEFNFGPINTQDLKITEEKVLPLLLHLQMVNFLSL